MAYNLPSPEQSCTLTADERAAEAERILRRIEQSSGGDSSQWPRAWTRQAREFVAQKQGDLELWGRCDVTVKQLLWLRNLAESVD